MTAKALAGSGNAMPLFQRVMGFTLFELFVAAALIGVLALVLLNRLSLIQEEAEKAAMDRDLATLNSAIAFRMAELITANRVPEIARLAGKNPMDWLQRKPVNYVGTYNHPKPGVIPPGSWYFDTGSGELVYRVQHGAHFLAPPGQSKSARFRVVLDGNGASSAANGAMPGIRLVSVSPYQWLEGS